MAELVSEREWLTRLMWELQQQQQRRPPVVITVDIVVIARPQDVRR